MRMQPGIIFNKINMSNQGKITICSLYDDTSSNGNIFRVTGHLCGEFTGPRWIPYTEASDAELWCFPWSVPEQTVEKTLETPSDLRGHRTHHDVTVMFLDKLPAAFDINTYDIQWIFDLRSNKRLGEQWWGWCFETPSSPLWRHFNGL